MTLRRLSGFFLLFKDSFLRLLACLDVKRMSRHHLLCVSWTRARRSYRNKICERPSLCFSILISKLFLDKIELFRNQFLNKKLITTLWMGLKDIFIFCVNALRNIRRSSGTSIFILSMFESFADVECWPEQETSTSNSVPLLMLCCKHMPVFFLFFYMHCTP